MEMDMSDESAAQAEPVKDLSARLAYRPNEVPAVLGVSRAAVYEMLKSGQLGSTKIGGKRLIPRREIERLLRGDEAALEAA